MDVQEYIKFEKNDIIEALEDYYEKKTNEKINISFDDKNMDGLNIKTITIRKSIASCKAEKIRDNETNPIGIKMDHDDIIIGGLSKGLSLGGMIPSSVPTWVTYDVNGIITQSGTSVKGNVTNT